jgi:hypothetical protein
MKPIPLSSFVPPVTGTLGRPSAVSSNRFDTSRNFRSRSGSFKRPRLGEEGELDRAFDITEPYPPLVNPPKPLFDVEAIKALMVDASNKATTIKAKADDPNMDEATKEFASFTISLYDLLTSVVEKAVIPLADRPPPSWPRSGGIEPPAVAPKPTPGKKELTEALLIAERTCVIFDAELGGASVGNKDRLAHAFSESVRNKALALAEEAGGSPEEVAITAAESIRVADDALSCATDISFLGQATKPYNNKRNASDPRNGSFHTMPVKLEFPDRNSRIYFERMMREKCKIKASMSLPFGIRKEAEICRKTVLEKYPGEIVMIRAEAEGLRFAAFHKRDGEGKWTRCPETYRIPFSSVLPEGAEGAESMEY